MGLPEAWQTFPESERLAQPEMFRCITKIVRQETERLGRPAVCVEIGAWCGASAVAMAEGGGWVISVDTFRASDRYTGEAALRRIRSEQTQTFEPFTRRVRESGWAAQIVAVVAWSTDAAELLGENTVDLLYVDGDHEPASVLADLAVWWPTVRPGGLILGHDWSLTERSVVAFSQLMRVTVARPSESPDYLPDQLWAIRKPVE